MKGMAAIKVYNQQRWKIPCRVLAGTNASTKNPPQAFNSIPCSDKWCNRMTEPDNRDHA